MKKFSTEQEEFWAGEFGEEYIERNKSKQVLASKIAFFAEALKRADNIKTLIEFGSNIGLNLTAINTLLPNCELSAIEINQKAISYIEELGYVKSYHTSILEYTPDYKRDITIICGVLIHINPEKLDEVYEKLYESSSKYILVAEYYNSTPVEIDYRGHKGKLFKRDFAGEILDKYPDLKLVDYGFLYHRDNNFSQQDDFNWFLLSK